MAYTVKQLARMSGVSVRTLHFYDELGLLTPAYHGDNGYRFYEEPQLLTLQQILFYRELGMELRRIKEIVGRADFAQLEALESHRGVLHEKLLRTSTLLTTIDKTIQHLKGGTAMSGEDMFTGFSVGAGQDRFDESITINGHPFHCKVSARDTDGAMCVFEFTGTAWSPRHLHTSQDEYLYIVDGEFEVEVGDRRFQARAGETVFLPRGVPHNWAAVGSAGRVLNTYQPAGMMEEFVREVSKYKDPEIHEVLGLEGLQRLFKAHGMELTGPVPPGWAVIDGRIVRTAS